MTERSAEPATAGWDADDDPNQETIALLQEEVARLEAELRARDEADRHPAAAAPGADDGAASRALRDRAEALAAELADRDETVDLLLEQSRLFEEAAAAQRAEWEQLNRWVDEVERRVEQNDQGGDRARADLDAERKRSEAIRLAAESDRRAWEAQRRGLEQEAERLRGRADRRGDAPPADDETAFLALASENRKLRDARAEMERTYGPAKQTAERLAAALAELEQARAELRRSEDDRQRERREYEAELGALRTRIAHDSLGRESPPAPADAPAAPAERALDPDERIRAFRQHLKELHDREDVRRADRTISARLSRLWRKTGPG